MLVHRRYFNEIGPVEPGLQILATDSFLPAESISMRDMATLGKTVSPDKSVHQ